MERSELERFREKLEFLASGLWDSGLRVKKLKGKAGRLVFEARISKGDRLLFTLGRDSGTSIVYAWSIECHDDVDRAKRSVPPENAPFLDFEPLSVEEATDLVIDDLAPEYYTQALRRSRRRRRGPSALENPGGLRLEETPRLLGPAEYRPAPLPNRGTARRPRAAPSPLPFRNRGLGQDHDRRILPLQAPSEGKQTPLRHEPPLSLRLLRAPLRRTDGGERGPARTGASPLRALSRYRQRDRREWRWPGNRRHSTRRARWIFAFELMLQGRKEFSSLDPELAWEEIRGIIKGRIQTITGSPSSPSRNTRPWARSTPRDSR